MKICLNTYWNRDHKEWDDYFVWWPQTMIDFGTGGKFLVWLETIRRRCIYEVVGHGRLNSRWEYRIKWPTHGEWNI